MSLDPRARAARARQLLEDDVLTAALVTVEADAVEALASADLADPKALQRHTAALQAARALRDQLQSVINSGNLAKRETTPVA